MAKISKNIKQFRSDRKMTQEALAEKINVTRQTVSSWETDRTQPDIDMLEALSGALSVGIEELIYGKKNKVGLEPEKKPDRKIYTIVLTIFGTLLTAAGLIIVFIEFWDELSAAKNFFAVMPLLAGFALGFFAVAKRPGSVPWREGSAVAWTAGIAITNALINSLNSIDMGFFPLMLLDGILLIPVMFITKGVFPFAAYFFAVSYSLFSLRDAAAPLFMLLYTLLLCVLFAAGVLCDRKNKSGDVTDIIRFWVLFAAFGFNFIASLCLAVNVRQYAFNFAVAVIFMFFTAVYAVGDKFSPRPVRQFGAIGIAVMYYFSMFGDNGYTSRPAAAFYIVPAVLLTGCTVCALLNRKNLAKDKLRLAILAMSVAELAIFFITIRSADELLFIKAIPAFGFAVAVIIKGVSEAKLLTANFGMLNAAAIIIILFMTSEADILAKGFVILAAGIVLLVINKLLIKKFSKEAEVKEDA